MDPLSTVLTIRICLDAQAFCAQYSATVSDVNTASGKAETTLLWHREVEVFTENGPTLVLRGLAWDSIQKLVKNSWSQDPF